jgi:hypothetical protein
VPHGHPNLRSQLHFGHKQQGDHEVHKRHVVALEKEEEEQKKMKKKIILS